MGSGDIPGSRIEAKGIHQLRDKGFRMQQFLQVDGPFTESPNRYMLKEFFSQKPGINADMVIDPNADDAAALAAYTIANKHFEVLGTNGTSALTTFSATEGGLTITTDTGDNDQMIILPQLDTIRYASDLVQMILMLIGKL